MCFRVKYYWTLLFFIINQETCYVIFPSKIVALILVVNNYFSAFMSVCHYIVRNVKEVQKLSYKECTLYRGNNMNQLPDSAVEGKDWRLSSNLYSDIMLLSGLRV